MKSGHATASLDRYESAVADLLGAQAHNEWFREVYWPENAVRVRQMVLDALAAETVKDPPWALDVGCAFGFASILLSNLGARVTAVDGAASSERDRIFQARGIEFFAVNLNAPDPLRGVASATFDAVLLGEVLEHILNHPLGMMRELARVLKPGGRLILTTPNPATLMNAWRLLQGRSLSWGATEFMEQPKLEAGHLSSYEGIHYHEYTTGELRHLLGAAGFAVQRHEFLGMGVSRRQSWLRRWLKTGVLVHRLFHLPWFGCTHYVVATKHS